MPLLDLQRRMRELGRIRTGEKIGNRPAKLTHFRLTSPSRPLIEAAAQVYGGKVTPWEDQWETRTTTDTLPIVIPPGQSLTQWWESWTGGGCVRRCDGETELLSLSPCLCLSETGMGTSSTTSTPIAKRQCKPTTRLSVILPAIPDIGVWRLEAHGYYAAIELAGTAELLERASAAGRLIPARLRLDQREKKVPGKPTLRYAVPVIEIDATVGELIHELVAGPDHDRLGIGPGDAPSMVDQPRPEDEGVGRGRSDGRVGEDVRPDDGSDDRLPFHPEQPKARARRVIEAPAIEWQGVSE